MSCPFRGSVGFSSAASSNNNASPKLNGSEEDDAGKSKKTTYGNYLNLDSILNSNHMHSSVHDEHLFISVHQVYELWFKQILYDMDSVRDMLNSNQVDESHQLIINTRMGRINLVMKLLLEQVHILETMTPFDFSAFRVHLGSSSGFESHQFRLLENKLGINPEWRNNYAQKSYTHVHDGEYLEAIKKSEEEPSMLTLVERWLERTPGLETDGFDFWGRFQLAVKRMLEDRFMQKESSQLENESGIKDEAEKLLMNAEYQSIKETFDSIIDVNIHNKLVARGERRLSHQALQGALLISFYRNEVRFHQPYQFLSMLMDLDSLLMKWRSNHVLMAQRMIGSKAGTGGSSGYQYLRSTLSDRYKVFVDLFNLATFHLPLEYIPPLPRRVKRLLSISNNEIPKLETLSLSRRKQMEEIKQKSEEDEEEEEEEGSN